MNLFSFLKNKVIFLVILLIFSINFANSKEMDFYGEKPSEEIVFIAGTAWFIFADGDIAYDTASKFETFLMKNSIPNGSHLFINSLGGSVYGGMELGRVIRKFNLNISIGTKGNKLDLIKRNGINSGYCYSACSFAYLGGNFRFFNIDKDKYGVHRFSTRGFEGNEEAAQIHSAAIVNYIREMNVDIKLFEIASKVDKNTIYLLSKNEMISLNIANNGTTKPMWEIVAFEGQMYLKAQRDTQYGMQKIMFMCFNKNIITIIMFESMQRENDILMHTAQDLVIDEKTYDIRKFIQNKTEYINGYMRYMYKLPKNMINSILSSNSISFYSKPTKQAVIFFGIESFKINDGREKLISYINSCK